MNIGNKNNRKNKEVDEEIFARIKNKFQEYWKILFWLIAIYALSYIIWVNLIAPKISEIIKTEGLTKDSLFLVIPLIITQGLLFSLDGWVTSLLKSPFGQMCYAINKAEWISEKTKDYLITEATKSSEHSKETLKKAGLTAIIGQLLRVFILGKDVIDKEQFGRYAHLFNLSLLIPLIFAAFSVLMIYKKLKKLEKNMGLREWKRN